MGLSPLEKNKMKDLILVRTYFLERENSLIVMKINNPKMIKETKNQVYHLPMENMKNKKIDI